MTSVEPVLIRSETGDGMNIGRRVNKADRSSTVVHADVVDRLA